MKKMFIASLFCASAFVFCSQEQNIAVNNQALTESQLVSEQVYKEFFLTLENCFGISAENIKFLRDLDAIVFTNKEVNKEQVLEQIKEYCSQSGQMQNTISSRDGRKISVYEAMFIVYTKMSTLYEDISKSLNSQELGLYVQFSPVVIMHVHQLGWILKRIHVILELVEQAGFEISEKQEILDTASDIEIVVTFKRKDNHGYLNAVVSWDDFGFEPISK